MLSCGFAGGVFVVLTAACGGGTPTSADGTPIAVPTEDPVDGGPSTSDETDASPTGSEKADASSTGEGEPKPGGSLPTCVPTPTCDGELPTTTKRPFKGSKPFGSAKHRGRDALFTTGAPQTLIGKFAYGAFDDDLKLEEVDIFVQRGCTGDWEKLGTVTTSTDEAPHATVDGVEDTGGRVYFDVPADKLLPEGRHRVAMIVPGDGTSTDLLVDVVPSGTRVVVSDIDGTLTSSETAEFFDGLSGTLPEAQPDAATVFTELAKKGFRFLYLTARPETGIARTRQFLNERGFPRGLVHTSTSLLPLVGDSAVTFKSTDIAALIARGASVPFAVGNTATDADAYEAAQIPKDGRIFYQYSDTAHGGRRIEAYAELLPELTSLAAICKP